MDQTPWWRRRAVAGAVCGGLVVAGIAAILLLRHESATPAPPNSPGSSPTLTTPAGPVAVYAFTAGQQNLQAPVQVVDQLKGARFHPTGIDWVIGWKLVEPGPGQFDWSVVDRDLAAASAGGYRSIVEVIPGEDDPAWLLQSCPDVSLTIKNTGKAVQICVPTSEPFLSAWTQMIAAFGHRYDGRPGLTMVQATGCGVQGEMQLPNHSSSFWSAYGVTSTALLAAWEQVATAWRQALPNTPSSLAIEEPLGKGNSDVLQPLLAFVRQHFMGAMWLQQNGLRQGTRVSPGSYGGDLLAASSGTTVGWQMFGAGAANGNLSAALATGLEAHPKFFEVYLSDVLNSSVAGVLQQVAAS